MIEAQATQRPQLSDIEAQGNSRLFWWGGLFFLVFLVLCLRISAPSDIYDNEQVEPIGFVNDLVANGNYLNQWTVHTFKDGVRPRPRPPLYTWLASPFVAIFGPVEWAFKMPSLIAVLGVCFFIFRLARSLLGLRGGVLAVAFWLCNYSVFKLGYTARADMLLTLGMVISLWALIKMREDWIETEAKPSRSPSLWKILVFWLGMTLGIMVKGPVAMLPVPFCWLIMLNDWWAASGKAIYHASYPRSGYRGSLIRTLSKLFLNLSVSWRHLFTIKFWKMLFPLMDSAVGWLYRRGGLLWHLLLGVMLPFGAYFGWFAMAYHWGGGKIDYGTGDLWFWQFQESYTDRLAGSGTGEHRVGNWWDKVKTRLNVPFYSIVRFLPWSVLFILGLVAQRWRFGPVKNWKIAMKSRKRYESRCPEEGLSGEGFPLITPYSSVWTVLWVFMVMAFFLLPASNRADYILSVFSAGAIFVAVVVVSATRRDQYHIVDVSGWVRIVLIALGIVMLGLSTLGFVPIHILDESLAGNLKMISPDHLSYRTRILIQVLALGMALCGMIGSIQAWRRRFSSSAYFLALAMVMVLGIYAHQFSPAAISWEGERQKSIVKVAKAYQLLHEKNTQEYLEIYFYDTGYTASMMLLGYNEWPVNHVQLNKLPKDGSFLLLTNIQVYEQLMKYKPASVIELRKVYDAGYMEEAELQLIMLHVTNKGAEPVDYMFLEERPLTQSAPRQDDNHQSNDDGL